MASNPNLQLNHNGREEWRVQKSFNLEAMGDSDHLNPYFFERPPKI